MRGSRVIAPCCFTLIYKSINRSRNKYSIFFLIQRRIDVLKIDIEGNEWPTLKTVLEEGAFQNITQFLLEFHGGPAVTKTEVLTRLNYLRAIRLLGYRIFYAHKNPLCAPKYNALSKTPFPTDCYEIHTIKIPSCAV